MCPTGKVSQGEKKPYIVLNIESSMQQVTRNKPIYSFAGSYWETCFQLRFSVDYIML